MSAAVEILYPTWVQNVNISLDVCSIMTLLMTSWWIAKRIGKWIIAPTVRWHQIWQRCKTSLFLWIKCSLIEVWSPSCEFMMQLCLTILILSPHKTRDGALQNTLKHLFRLRNNDVLHFCHNWCQRRAGAQHRWLLTSQLSSRLVKKVMTEHTSKEILTFCV